MQRLMKILIIDYLIEIKKMKLAFPQPQSLQLHFKHSRAPTDRFLLPVGALFFKCFSNFQINNAIDLNLLIWIVFSSY